MDASSRARAITDELRRPLPIEAAEELEAEVKRAWSERLLDGTPDPHDAYAFSALFASIGFIRKYKPYGTKFAAPFGYSIFALHDGRGFSIQLHRTAKVEAFHVRRAGSEAFVLLADAAEWDREGEEFLRLWREGRPTDSPLAVRPSPGDVVVIQDLEMVHTVVGCLVEELATTSNDAVERLHDQNEGLETTLPGSHHDLRAELERDAAATPTRLLRRAGAEWETHRLPDAEQLVALPEAGLRGGHLRVAREHGERTIRVPEGDVATVACLHGEATLALRAGRIRLRAAETCPLAPGELAALSTHAGAASLAVCFVRKDLAFADLR